VIEAEDFVLEHFDIDLDPHNPGEIRIGMLQLPNASAWRSISGRTSYIIAPDGKIIAGYTKLDPSDHVSQMLAALKDWRAKRR